MKTIIHDILRRCPKFRDVRSVILLFLLGQFSGCAQKSSPPLQRAFKNIEAYIDQHMQQYGTPGFTLALTTKDSLLYVGTFGYADIKLKTPVTETTLFQVGSITKSFTALALMQLYDQGKFDPQRPVRDYLPWFDVRSKYEPLTPHHLLTHSAGIPANRDDITASPYQAYALRQQATGWPPNTRFHYSNIGYQVLHVLLEKLANKPYAEIIEERFFKPLGMIHSQPVITLESRSLQSVGYIPPYDDRPHHRSRQLIEAPHFNYGVGDGSIQSTATDLAAYVRLLLNNGRGPRSRLVSEKAFQVFSTPHIALAQNTPETGYGYGIFIEHRNEHRYLRHSGGMVGFVAYMEADLTDGLGVVAMANGPAALRLVTRYSLSAVSAALHNKTIPPPPTVSLKSIADTIQDYIGDYRGVDGETVRFTGAGDSALAIEIGSERIMLDYVNDDLFYTVHPDFDRYYFEFKRDSNNVVVEVFHGPKWYINDHYHGAKAFDVPDRWKTYVGRYRSYSPWLPYVEVFERKGHLLLVTGEGGEASSDEIELFESGPGEFRMDAEATPEMIRFEDVVDGHALRLIWTGHPLFRSRY